MESKPQSMLNVSTKTFISALIILFALMVLTYALTFILPSGEYQRIETDGQVSIVPDTYAATEGGIPFWKWLLSPFLVLGGSGGGAIIAICALLIVIGGAFTALDASGVMRYMLSAIYARFASRRYTLLALVTLFFMALGSFVGSFEEVVPLVPLAVALAYCLGWDALTGLGMSIFAVCMGFSCGVANVFTIGVAQRLAGLPLFSGIWLRAVIFVVIYAALTLFLRFYARRIEADPTKSSIYDPDAAGRWAAARLDFSPDPRMARALTSFAVILGLGILTILFSAFITVLQDLLMVIVAFMFLLAGTLAVLLSGYGVKGYFKAFGKGVVMFLPALLMILMASSVRYTMEQAKILDTILYAAATWAAGASTGAVALLIYALVLVMNFFIGSASAKAFLLIPIIAPLAEMCAVSKQVAVLAFAFGDGFSNILYPTNAVLLISLGLAGVSYGKWAKWSLKFQIPVLIFTVLALLAANAIGY